MAANSEHHYSSPSLGGDQSQRVLSRDEKFRLYTQLPAGMRRRNLRAASTKPRKTCERALAVALPRNAKGLSEYHNKNK